MPEKLLIPNVKTRVAIPNKPVILAIFDGRFSVAGYYDYPQMYEEQREYEQSETARLENRDWRQLRTELLKSKLNEYLEAEAWLVNAGYFLPDELIERGPDVLRILRAHRDILVWLMELEVQAFKKAIRAAHDLFRDQQSVWAARISAGAENRRLPKLKSPYEDFRRALKLPLHLDFELLKAYLMGTGTAPSLLANFQWNSDGTPSIVVNVLTPLEAIGLSVHIDKNFSVRQWMICASCKSGFEKQRGDGRFCSARCKNFFTTKARREKIRQLHLAIEAWDALSPDQRSSKNHWKWVAEWVKQKSAGEIEIDPAWGKKQVATAKRRRRK